MTCERCGGIRTNPRRHICEPCRRLLDARGERYCPGCHTPQARTTFVSGYCPTCNRKRRRAATRKKYDAMAAVLSAECVCGCGRPSAYGHRGLSTICYRRLKEAGRLADYPGLPGYPRPNRERNACSVCGAPHYARGYCVKHYARVLRTGDPMAARSTRRQPERCTVDGCDKPTEARGMCAMHYSRQRRQGLKEAA